MVISSVLSLTKELDRNEAVARPDDCPRASSQDMGGRFFRRVTLPGLSVVTIDQKGGELLLGAIEFFRNRNLLKGEQNVVRLKRH